MAKEVRAQFGRLTVLVNSADWFAQDSFPTEDYETWRRVLDITVHGSFYVSNELAPLLLEQPQAAIVNYRGHFRLACLAKFHRPRGGEIRTARSYATDGA